MVDCGLLCHEVLLLMILLVKYSENYTGLLCLLSFTMFIVKDWLF